MMNARRIIGIVMCGVGVILIFLSLYMKDQIAHGNVEISQGESRMKTGKTLFGTNPYTKEAGNQMFFNSGDERIRAGKDEIAYYEARSNQIMTIGIISIIIGIVLVVIPVSRKRSGIKW